ncbi:MAG: hypothetical protein GX297_06790 [Treponema sp.]|jgi:hypothetical protein|nr:hypothetical protein [Treponema sp.]
MRQVNAEKYTTKKENLHPTPQVLGLLEANSLPKNHEQFNLNRCSMNFSINNAGNDIIKDILEPATGEGCSK